MLVDPQTLYDSERSAYKDFKSTIVKDINIIIVLNDAEHVRSTPLCHVSRDMIHV